ncbi:MAG: beta-lactamase family protein [Clostridia bacterium]|nr:beta-lactamase family protein [Clostridia bacterium]
MKIINEHRLASLSEEIAKKYGIPGMDAVLIKNGEIVSRHIQGVTDTAGTPVKEDTLYESASLTKALFACLFLRLADRGIVDLDQPAVAQGAPVWSGDPRFAEITPRQCLCHGTGLPNWSEKPMPFKFDPGTSYSYSGEGYYLLQHLAEVKLGRSWPQIMHEEFFGPWAMDVDVVWTPELAPRISNGFDKENKLRKIRDSIDTDPITGEPNAAWSFYANAKYYAHYVCSLMKDRCGLSEESFREMTRVQNHAADGVDWGLGWGITDGVCWHWGDDRGYKNFVCWDPETKDGAVVYTNTDIGMPFYFELLASFAEGLSLGKIKAFIESAE